MPSPSRLTLEILPVEAADCKQGCKLRFQTCRAALSELLGSGRVPAMAMQNKIQLWRHPAAWDEWDNSAQADAENLHVGLEYHAVQHRSTKEMCPF